MIVRTNTRLKTTTIFKSTLNLRVISDIKINRYKISWSRDILLFFGMSSVSRILLSKFIQSFVAGKKIYIKWEKWPFDSWYLPCNNINMSWVNIRLNLSGCAQHCVIQSLIASSRGSDLKWHRIYYCIYRVFPTFMLTTRKVSGMLHSSVVERCTRGLQHIPLVPVSITQGTYFQRMRWLNFGIVSRGMWWKTASFDLLKIRAEQGIPVSAGSSCVWAGV